MQCNSKTANSVKTQTGCVGSEVRKSPTRKIPYRVGYEWNKVGRLKELRKRHLARKFLKIWILNTFGRILPHTAKSHHQSVVLRRAFEGWNNEWWTSRREWCLATRANCHYRYFLYNLTFQHWQTFVALQKEKKSKVQCAVQFAHRRMLRLAWNRWEILRRIQMKKRMLESALDLKRLKTLQSSWHMWQTRLQQHQNLHILEKQRLQSSQQRMLSKHWKLWQDCLEEAEGKHFQPLREMALAKHSTCLQRSCFNHWRERLAERRHMQELPHQSDVCFAKHMLPLCFKTWVEFTQQRTQHKRRKHQADIYNQQRLQTWVFYTWWALTEKHKDQMLSERIAVVHEEQRHLQRTWRCWKEKINDKEKQFGSPLLHKNVTQWEDDSPEIQDRRHQSQQDCHQSDLHGRKSKQVTLEGDLGRAPKRIDPVTIVRDTWVKKCFLQVHQFNSHTEELCGQQVQNTLRYVVSVWKVKAMLQRESRLMEEQAQNHYRHFIQLKVFIAWREATASAVSTCCQQGETLTRFQMFKNQGGLLQYFRQWKKEAAHARSEKTYMERARWHHESKLLSKAMKTWNEHHNQYHVNKVMRRQGMFLLRLKMYQKFFDLWKVKLQHRRREAELTEQALWHWSLTLQAKVLCGWRRWVTEQQINQAQAAGAAQVDRDEPLMEDVKCFLTSAAHMKDVSAGLTGNRQEQESLCRVVRRCGLQWKQRTLCKAKTVQELKDDPQKKKSVAFNCTMPKLTFVPPPDSVEQEDEVKELQKLLANRAHRRQPRRPQGLLESPLSNLYKQSAITDTVTAAEPVVSHLHPVSSIQHTPDSSRSHVMLRECSSCSETEDPASSLITELLSIQRDMNSYQQDRKQLQAWKKLKKVLQNWKQTSGRYDDQAEQNAVCQEIKELGERIDRLSTELAKQKPRMLLHTDRIQRLQMALARHSVLTASHC